MKRLINSLILCLVTTSLASAAEGFDTVRKRLVEMTGQQPDALVEAPVPGLVEARFGSDVVYLTTDGRYLLSGTLLDLATGVNLTEQRKETLRKTILDGIDEASMITYKAVGKAKHVVTVLTDIDCSYCRRLHKGMSEMNKLGIEIRYMAYPRAGIGSGSYQKLVNVWCADDRQQAMTNAKNEQVVRSKSCANPVADHYQAGRAMGVTGTPALVLASGKLLPGYLPPKELLATLNGENPKQR